MQKLIEACYLAHHEGDGIRSWLASTQSITEYHLTTRSILRQTIDRLNSKITRGSVVDLFCRSMILAVDTVDFENIKLSYEIFVN